MESTTEVILEQTSIGQNRTTEAVAGPYFQHIWIAAQVGCVVMFLGSIVSIASFYSYGKRKGKWSNTKQGRNHFILLLLAILTPCGVAFRILLTQSAIISDILVSTKEAGDQVCKVLPDIVSGCFCLATLPTYVFFWKRLRVLYTQVLLKELDTKIVRGLTHFSILIYIIGTVGGNILLIAPDNVIMSDYGCIFDQEKPFNWPPFFMCGVLLMISQTIMFVLFIYPLRFQRSKFKSVDISSSAQILARRLRRTNLLATMSMAICTVSDFFAMIMVIVVLPSATPISFLFSIYDFSCFVNIYAVMLSFEEYREIISFGACTKV